jgi:GAF domain-containing protein
VLDVGDGPAFPQDMLLPETRSAAVFPMRWAGGVVGVLQVQEKEREAFDAEDLDALQVIADQTATFAKSARLLQQVRASVEAERRSHAEAARTAWEQLLLGQPGLGFRRDRAGLSRTVTAWRPHMERAVRTQKTALGVSADGSPLAVPITVREQVIGVIDARKALDRGRWTKDEVELLETLAEQLTLALDNARLYQAARGRSLRDRQLRAISERMQAQPDLDAMFQTVVTDLAGALDVPAAYVQLNPGLRLPRRDISVGSKSEE